MKELEEENKRQYEKELNNLYNELSLRSRLYGCETDE